MKRVPLLLIVAARMVLTAHALEMAYCAAPPAK